jgi:hypothetical protein
VTGREGWVADASIGWRILLSADLPEPPHVADARTAPTVDELRRALVAPAPEPVLVGVSGRTVVVSAHHGAADGLGLLRVLDGLGLGPVTSSARGIGDRPPAHGYVGTVARRLAEAALRPPASVTPSRTAPEADGDAMVEAEVEGSYRTAVLVRAAVEALVARGAGRHVAVAVGATRDPATAAEIGNNSALLRIRDAERLDLPGIERALREAPAERPPVAGSGGVDRVAAVAMRALARRLGSTLLVSHLGEVTAPQVDRLSFHPVTAGGTGLALGAVGNRGRTVHTLRARASAGDADGLEQLLEAVGGRLSER